MCIKLGFKKQFFVKTCDVLAHILQFFNEKLSNNILYGAQVYIGFSFSNKKLILLFIDNEVKITVKKDKKNFDFLNGVTQLKFKSRKNL
jgi:hypothetical protein